MSSYNFVCPTKSQLTEEAAAIAIISRVTPMMSLGLELAKTKGIRVKLFWVVRTVEELGIFSAGKLFWFIYSISIFSSHAYHIS